MATVGRHFHLCGVNAVLMKDVSCFAATGAARRQSGRSFSIKDAVGMHVTYMHNGFLRGVKKPYLSCLSAATSAGQISKKHSRDTHVNLFFCTKAACLAGLSDRRLRHKHTSFWMFQSKTTLMAHMTVSLLFVTSTTAGNQEYRSATGADRTLSSGPVLARTYVNPSPRRVFLKGFFMLPEAAG